MELVLTAKQRRELEKIVTRATEEAQVVRRAQVVLWSAGGVGGAEIAKRLRLSPEAVSRIRRRFLTTGVPGLATQPKAGRKDHAVPTATVARIVELAMSPPPAGRSRWTTRLLAKEVGLTSGCVSDLLRRHQLKPHRVRTYKVSRDPAFAAKVRDVLGLYLDPPEHAVVLSGRREDIDPGVGAHATTAPAALGPGHATHARLQASRRRRSIRSAGSRHRSGHPSADRDANSVCVDEVRERHHSLTPSDA
jgi:transposase